MAMDSVENGTQMTQMAMIFAVCILIHHKYQRHQRSILFSSINL